MNKEYGIINGVKYLKCNKPVKIVRTQNIARMKVWWGKCEDGHEIGCTYKPKTCGEALGY